MAIYEKPKKLVTTTEDEAAIARFIEGAPDGGDKSGQEKRPRATNKKQPVFTAKRKVQISVNFMADELDALIKYADERNMARSVLVREIVLKAIGYKRPR